ncbi:MAG: AAA family ATPase [Thermaerobacter sp.]|nr:AAA family ATPase [Thermaerobacter sp.]
MGRVLAVANQKGGVGKTTTAINLGACLAERGQKVLLGDVDPQGNATTGLGIAKRPEDPSMYEVIVEGIPVRDCIRPTLVEGMHMIPGSVDLAGAEIELVAIQRREYRLRDALAAVRSRYDYILLDCPPSLGLMTLNALVAADAVLIPLQTEYYALEGLTQLMRTVQLVQGSLNPALTIDGIVLTMFDARTNLGIQVVDEVKRHFPDKVYRSVVPRNVRLSEAPSHGRPISRYDPRSRGTEVYRELAQEVLIRGKAGTGART